MIISTVLKTYLIRNKIHSINNNLLIKQESSNAFLNGKWTYKYKHNPKPRLTCNADVSEAFLLRQEWSLPILYNFTHPISTTEYNQEKVTQSKKCEGGKTIIFADDIYMHLENQRETTEKEWKY